VKAYERVERTLIKSTLVVLAHPLRHCLLVLPISATPSCSLTRYLMNRVGMSLLRLLVSRSIRPVSSLMPPLSMQVPRLAHQP
jgi:hypothetical protein